MNALGLVDYFNGMEMTIEKFNQMMLVKITEIGIIFCDVVVKETLPKE